MQKGWSPLLLAAGNGHTETCKTLITAGGADVNRRNKASSYSIYTIVILVIVVSSDNIPWPHMMYFHSSFSAFDVKSIRCTLTCTCCVFRTAWRLFSWPPGAVTQPHAKCYLQRGQIWINEIRYYISILLALVLVAVAVLIPTRSLYGHVICHRWLFITTCSHTYILHIRCVCIYTHIYLYFLVNCCFFICIVRYDGSLRSFPRRSHRDMWSTGSSGGGCEQGE